jgi:hypothetical protein
MKNGIRINFDAFVLRFATQNQILIAENPEVDPENWTT